MCTSVIILNGVPGAGKTTLAVPLALELGVPLIGKDAIKEGLADLVSVPLPTRRLGALASETMWNLAALIDGPVVVESFWAAERDEGFLQAGLRTAGARRAVELWCEVPLGLARERFSTRHRHSAHDDTSRLEEWETMAATARPCSGQPALRVATAGAVDVPALAARIRRLLQDDRSLIPLPEPAR